MTCPPNIGPGVMLKFSWMKGVGYRQVTSFLFPPDFSSYDITKSESLVHLFDAIGLTALAVAVLDLAITIFREVILREVDKRHPSHLRRSLTRFATIIIIATLIEGFIMIFRFNKADQTHLLLYSTLVFIAATLLIVGLGIFLKITIPVEKLIEKAEK